MGHDNSYHDECEDRFWVEDPTALLTDFSLIPRAKMSLEQKLNIITRIVIIVWIILLIIKYKHATAFLMTSLLVIVLIYYSRKRHEERINRILSAMDHKSEKYRYEVRGGHPTSVMENPTEAKFDRDDGFMRFEAKAGNFTAKNSESNQNEVKETIVTNRANNLMETESEVEHRRLKATLKKQKHLKKLKKLEDKLQKEQEKIRQHTEEKSTERNLRKKNQDDKVVQGGEVKRDPRRPWPPTVPFSMEVQSGNGMISQEAAHVPQPHVKKPEHQFQGKNEDPRPADRDHVDHEGHSYGAKRDVKSYRSARFDDERSKNLQRSYLGGPNRLADSKFHGYHVEAFQDDESGEEVDDEESSINQYQTEQEKYSVRAVQGLARNNGSVVVEEDLQSSKPAAVPKRTFLPSNYDGSMEKPAPIKNEGPKMTRHGAARTRRVPKWNDNNQLNTMHEASEMQFNRAAKLEEQTNTKGRINRERKSQVRSLFG